MVRISEGKSVSLIVFCIERDKQESIGILVIIWVLQGKKGVWIKKVQTCSDIH